MTIEATVASAIAILSPYIASSATKAAEVVGEGIAKGAGKLLGKIRGWFAGDEDASTALSQFEKKPVLYASPVEQILLEKSRADPAMGEELTRLVAEVGPRAEVIQKIRSLAGQAVGFDFAKWETGFARAYQEVDTVAPGGSLTGMKLGK